MSGARELAQKYRFIAGVDEAGRGPLAGPIVAAACILPSRAFFKGLDDSKKLTPEVREHLFAKITSRPSLFYGVGVVDAQTIDQINIHEATLLAMKLAIENLPQVPDYILVDGAFLPSVSIPGEALKQGDTYSIPIMA